MAAGPSIVPRCTQATQRNHNVAAAAAAGDTPEEVYAAGGEDGPGPLGLLQWLLLLRSSGVSNTSVPLEERGRRLSPWRQLLLSLLQHKAVVAAS